ncbi:DUF3613 domain-containing protein [Chitinasiproducens palmae]|uniref:DUF3613 domain-containing protein n=1 Tax=Chitinasiproducens palmae TaxID=1770053 RepID=A0A1H2PV72_9BURK|nr:DUF3613 domain-containing protein [Chitinasiproducens palmae]SDV51154.1 Protein of unknown function [Chitinasiproducens palmae]
MNVPLLDADAESVTPTALRRVARGSAARAPRLHALWLSPLLLLAFATCGWAQEATETTAQTSSPGSAARLAPADGPHAVGDTTRALLAAQADGTQAGAPLPMLGETASLSYRRYAQSFSHPIPAFFEQAVSAEHAK